MAVFRASGIDVTEDLSESEPVIFSVSAVESY